MRKILLRAYPKTAKEAFAARTILNGQSVFRWVLSVLGLSVIVASSVFAQDVSPSVQLDFSKSDGKTVCDALDPAISNDIYFGDIQECGKTKVLAFDAITHIVLENTRGLDFEDGITITAWICPTKMARNTMVVGRPNPNRDWTTPTLGLYFPSHNRLGIGIWTPKACRLEADTKITAGQWIFAACTWDRKTAKIYINGELKAKEACTGKLPKFHAPLGIGCGNPANQFFKGKLGEIRVYERAISGEAIHSLYKTSQALYPENVLAKPMSKTIIVKAKVNPKSEWKNFPTRTLDSLPDLKASAATGRNGDGSVELSKYGGWKAKRSKPTGFFRAEKINGRWWLIDPEGYYFIHVGVACVRVGSSPKSIQACKKLYGGQDRWAENALALLSQNYFNGIGNWSDYQTLRDTSRPMPYVIRGGFLGGFAGTKGLWKQVPGHAGYTGDVPPIFVPGFKEYCAKRAAKYYAEYKDDPYLVGVFSDNEIIWPDLEKFLKLDCSDPLLKASHDAAVDWLKKRRKTEEVSSKSITLMERLEFSAYAFDHYYNIVSKAIRGVLPNHMYLGSRLHGSCCRNPLIVQSCGRYADVISINYYHAWNPDAVESWEKVSGRPVMITEFYTKGEDSGLPNTTGAGWIVPTQADRGRFYQNFILGLVESKGCVGWHWFKYMDNDPDNKKVDPSNIDSNKGIFQVDFTPYSPLLQAMKEINREVYPLTEYFDRSK